MDKNLAAFVVIVEKGNLTAAADSIGLAQPSLTKRLKLLEDEYGTQLFQRLPHGMELTKTGRLLYKHSKLIQQDYLQAKEAINAVRAGHLDVLRVGAGPLYRHTFLPDVFATLRKEFPKTQLMLNADIHLKNIPLLKQGGLDIVFGAISKELVDSSIVTRDVIDVELGVLARRDNPLCGKKEITVEDLVGLQWILYSDDPMTLEMVNRYFRQHNQEPPNFAIQTNSYEFGMVLISTGEYVMPAPIQLDLTSNSHAIAPLPITEPISRFTSGAYLRRSSLEFPIVRRLLELVEMKAAPQ